MIELDYRVLRLLLNTALNHGWQLNQLEIHMREDVCEGLQETNGFRIYRLPQSYPWRMLVCIIDEPWYVYPDERVNPTIVRNWPEIDRIVNVATARDEEA